MNVTKAEAQASLDAIESIMARTRRVIAGSGCGDLLLLWGVIWLIGFSATQFFPNQSGLLWLGLDAAGILGSWAFGCRSRSTAKCGNGARIGLAWMALFVYAGIWVFILHPSEMRFFGAYPATVAMFGYVVMGLWLDRMLLFLGLAVTVTTLTGILLLPDWFNLWMAVTGGGSLIAAGIHIRRNWN